MSLSNRFVSTLAGYILSTTDRNKLVRPLLGRRITLHRGVDILKMERGYHLIQLATFKNRYGYYFQEILFRKAASKMDMIINSLPFML